MHLDPIITGRDIQSAEEKMQQPFMRGTTYVTRNVGNDSDSISYRITRIQDSMML